MNSSSGSNRKLMSRTFPALNWKEEQGDFSLRTRLGKARPLVIHTAPWTVSSRLMVAVFFLSSRPLWWARITASDFNISRWSYPWAFSLPIFYPPPGSDITVSVKSQANCMSVAEKTIKECHPCAKPRNRHSRFSGRRNPWWNNAHLKTRTHTHPRCLASLDKEIIYLWQVEVTCFFQRAHRKGWMNP